MSAAPEVRIEHLHTYTGPSIYAYEPAVIATLDVSPDVLVGASARIARMTHACRDWFYWSHDPGDSDAALGLGKFLVHWALCALTEVRGALRVAKALVEDEHIKHVLGYHSPPLSLTALELAATIFSNIYQLGAADIDAKLNDFWRHCRRLHPDFQACILMTAARGADIPVLPFSERTRHWQYGWGARSKVFFESVSTANSLIGSQFADNKSACIALLRTLGAPTPAHVVIGSADELEKALPAVGYPCVVKPLRGRQGQGVTARIADFDRARAAFDAASQASAGPVMVEQFVPGDDHRLMIANGKFIAAIRREAPSVTGDGQRTVRELIAELNASRSSNQVRSRYLRPIQINGAVLDCLSAQRADPDTVPPSGQRVMLRTNANLTTGGRCTDVTQQVHPMLRVMAEHLASAMGLPTAGFDYITTDISQSPWESGGAFIEANTVPGLDAVLAAGWSAEAIGAALFDGIGRIPVTLFVIKPSSRVTVTDSGDANRPLVARVAGRAVYVGGAVYRVASAAPWAAVRAALRNSAVQELEIFCTPSEITAHGLPVDRLERTVLTGVRLPDSWHALLESHSRDLEIERA